MVYQYNNATRNSEEVSLPEGSVLRDQEWVELLNAQSREAGSNCFYSTEIIIEDDDLSSEDMDAFFKSMEEEDEG